MNTKMTHIFSSIVVLASIIATPFAMVAASTNTDGADGFTRGLLIWRKGNSAMQDAIQKLDDQKVQDLAIPVLTGVGIENLSKNFGDPRSNHSHAGLDIMAAEGVPVASPTDAVVIRISFDAGSGNYVMVAAPGGESFAFMHLSKVAKISEGDVLKPGDIIGYVGHTGNAIASAPHLHFEVRNENGIATDPFPRLTKVFTTAEKKESLDRGPDYTVKSKEVVKDQLKIVTPVVNVLTTINTSMVLKVGARGSDVATLQTYLIKKNIGAASLVKADGAFGPITRKAVIDLQASAGLVADGVAGPKTLAYIASH